MSGLLFDREDGAGGRPDVSADAPLADRMRPRSLDEVEGPPSFGQRLRQIAAIPFYVRALGGRFGGAPMSIVPETVGKGDIGIKNGRIAATGRLPNATTSRIVDPPDGRLPTQTPEGLKVPVAWARGLTQ